MNHKSSSEPSSKQSQPDNLAQSLAAICSDKLRYYKNTLYITPEQQVKMSQTRVVLAGVGLASVLAEAALRIGFERFVLIDGDQVECTNLNRQNYTEADIGGSKVAAIAKRLRAINPHVEIVTVDSFLSDHDSIRPHLASGDIAINAIDFDDSNSSVPTPFVFDQVCQSLNVTVIHPLNFGWAGAAYVIKPDGQQLFDVERDDQKFEFSLVEGFLQFLRQQPNMAATRCWLEQFITDYKVYSTLMSPPQLAVGSYLTAGLVTDILYRLVNDLPIKTYPEPYFITAGE